ncbi:MAG: response regulator [Lachnospiraceae bacterium]|nr:response regulator [Lachnospiraceae bacterium]
MEDIIVNGADNNPAENTSIPNVGRVLIIDDVEVNRFVLRNIIADMGYQPILAENGVQALKILQRTLPNLIMTDVSMPEMDGFEFAGIIKSDVNTRDIPIIFISAFDEVDDIIKGFEIGGEDYITKPFIPEVVKARVGVQLKFHETRKSLQETNTRLQLSLGNQLKQIESEKKTILYALVNLARNNSLYEDKYIDRLQYNCKMVAQALQIAESYVGIIDDTFVETIEMAAPLCDIGNVAIAKEILQKPEPISDGERRVIETHTTIGAKILTDIALSQDYNDFVRMAVDIAHYHHENWDGTGYPDKKMGDQIPLSAQIVAFVSMYCALTADRAYRVSYTREEALDMLKAECGVKFNPVIFDICCKIYRQLH